MPSLRLSQVRGVAQPEDLGAGFRVVFRLQIPARDRLHIDAVQGANSSEKVVFFNPMGTVK
jgi:hypothetical protein